MNNTYSYTPQPAATGNLVVLFIVYAILIIFYVIVNWKIFTKAGQPGWAAIIPFYNLYILMKIIGRPGWWFILYLIPVVNIVFSLIVSIDLAKSFGRSSAFGVILLWLFAIIGYPMLAFGKSQYVGPGGQAASQPQQPVAAPAVQAQPMQPAAVPTPAPETPAA